MLRIGICDDNANSRNHLRLNLEKILRNQENVNYFEFSCGEGVVKWVQKHAGELDLLFLDVEMNGISGIEAAKQIRQSDTEIMLVFVTGYSDYVFDGYTVQALDYIIKPVKTEKLQEIIHRANSQIQMQKPQVFIVQNADGFYRINKENILYFYSDKRVVKLVTQHREYAFYDKLDNVAKKIGSGFVRIHQRYLVRAEAVNKVVGNTTFIGEAELPISRSLYHPAMLAFAHTLLRGDALD